MVRASVAVFGMLVVAGCVAPAATDPEGGDASAGSGLVVEASLAIATADRYLWEPHAAINPSDASHAVVAVSLLTGVEAGLWAAEDTLVAVTRDGGATWLSHVLPKGPAAGPDHAFASSSAITDSILAFAPDGSVLLLGLAYHSLIALGADAGLGQGFSVFLARSTDGGDSFPDVQLLDSDAGVALRNSVRGAYTLARAPDYPSLSVAADGSLLATWVRVHGVHAADEEAFTEPVFAVSTDEGRSWSAPAPLPLGGRSGSAHAVWNFGNGTFVAIGESWVGVDYWDQTDFELVAHRSDDWGQTWVITTLIADIDGALATVAFGAAGLVTAYTREEPDGRHEIILRRSVDRGLTWGPEEPLGTGGFAAYPMPTLGSDGDAVLLLAVAAQPDGASAMQLSRVHADGVGASVVVATDVTGQGVFMGDYLVVAGSHGRFLPVWPDNGAEYRLQGAWATTDASS